MPWLILFAGFAWCGYALAERGNRAAASVSRAITAVTQAPMWILGDSQACWCSGLTTDKNPSRAFLSGLTVAGAVDCKIGSRVADWNAHVENVPVRPGDRVLVFLGSNEMDGLPDPTKIVESLRRRGVTRITWVGPPLIRGKGGQAIGRLQSICARLNVPYFDSRTIELKQDKAGVHPMNQAEADRWLAAALNY